MLPDIIQWDEIHSGSDRGGVFSGTMFAFEKCGFALGSLFSGIVLAWSGYIESTGGDVVQPASALWGIKVIIGIVPCVVMLLGAAVIMRYPLTERTLKEKMVMNQDMSTGGTVQTANSV